MFFSNPYCTNKKYCELNGNSTICHCVAGFTGKKCGKRTKTLAKIIPVPLIELFQLVPVVLLGILVDILVPIVKTKIATISEHAEDGVSMVSVGFPAKSVRKFNFKKNFVNIIFST